LSLVGIQTPKLSLLMKLRIVILLQPFDILPYKQYLIQIKQIIKALKTYLKNGIDVK